MTLQIDSCVNNYNFEEAIALITNEDSQDAELLLKKARCYQGLGEYDRAVSILENLSLEDDKNIQLKIELANCFLSANRLPQAELIYLNLSYIQPNNRHFRLQYADILYRRKQYTQALELYLSLSKQYGLPAFYRKTAQCFEAMNLFDDAIYYYEKAWQGNFNDSFSAASLINLNLKKECFEEAIIYSTLFIAKDSTDQQINLLNALAYYGTSDFDIVIKRLKPMFEKGDSSLIITKSLGLSYFFMEDYQSAIPFLKSAYVQDTKNNNVLYSLSYSLLSRFDYDEAIFYFNKLLEATVPTPQTLYPFYKGLADAYYKSGHFAEAAENYKFVLDNSINPGENIIPLQTLVNIYENREWIDNKQALHYYNELKTEIEKYILVIEELKIPNYDSVIKNAQATLKNIEPRIKELKTKVSQ